MKPLNRLSCWACAIMAVVFAVMALSTHAQVTVNTFAAEAHSGGATVTKQFDFPADISMYDQIEMHISLTCPPGGCDPWDRFGMIRVQKNGQSYEIGRFITPYGNDWCNWTLDVSDYRDLLQGDDVTLISHIETWSNGWALTVDFEFSAGTPAYAHTSVQNLFVDYNFGYGDTLFFSNDLPEHNIPIPAEAQKVVLRIANTGHGQGNSENAAEFSQKTHTIEINGQQQFSQYLWKADCAMNPCSPQAGTWQFDRAGWCPGEVVPPHDYDITSLVTPGQNVSIDYVLDTYFNECSPWNPGCDDGVTCPECTYNANGHTEAHYKIAVQMLYSGADSIPVLSVPQLVGDDQVTVYPNPSSNEFMVKLNDLSLGGSTLIVTDINGRVVQQRVVPNLASRRQLLVDLNREPAGLYLLTLQSEQHLIQKKLFKTNR